MNILGINYSNDSAAALLVDGRRVAASQEERFSRQKHDRSFPLQAIKMCLKTAGLKAKDLDAVAFFWNPGRHLEPMLSRLSPSVRHHSEYLINVPNYMLQMLGQPGVSGMEQILHLENGRKLHIHYVDHHIAHTTAAFYNSPYDDAAILTIDGYGEKCACMIASASDKEIKPLWQQDYPHSIGALYASVSQWLGFKPNSGEGKVMGLASYGDRSLYDTFKKLVRFTDNGFEIDLSYFNYTTERTTRYSQKFVDLFGPPRVAESEITPHYENVASALQYVTEDLMLHLARMALKMTGKSNLCLAGGVALNVVGNRRVQFESGCKSLFILPPAGDPGTSIGAAQYVAHVLNKDPRDPRQYLEYLGYEASPAEMAEAVTTSGAASAKPANLERVAARLLANGKIIGLYQGQAEYGPRALGNRSIMTAPYPAAMKDVLNARVKFREHFRPFAPSCLEERCGDMFDSNVPSPFMLRVYNTKPEWADKLAAITHVDGGARVQTVNPSQNARYYKIIQEFDKATGVPCILNTSFNIRGEPIVNTAKEALFCYFGTDMDYLFLGDHLVAKNQQALNEALKQDTI